NSRPRKLKISGYIRDDRLRAFFSSRTDIGDALTPLSVAIPAIAKTKNMRRYREDSWLRNLDSNHDPPCPPWCDPAAVPVHLPPPPPAEERFDRGGEFRPSLGQLHGARQADSQ